VNESEAGRGALRAESELEALARRPYRLHVPCAPDFVMPAPPRFSKRYPEIEVESAMADLCRDQIVPDREQ
jgi:DNA-binding transcriptional LysR family regulator